MMRVVGGGRRRRVGKAAWSWAMADGEAGRVIQKPKIEYSLKNMITICGFCGFFLSNAKCKYSANRYLT